jgi:predicted nucleic acid-binding protein
MVEAPRVLLDVNVVLDALQSREPSSDDAVRVLACAESRAFTGLLAAHTVTTLFHLMARHASPAVARVQIGELLSILSVAAVDQDVLHAALALPVSDFEDCVQMAAARQAGADYVVTRDRVGFAAGPVPTRTPAELLALLGGFPAPA